MEDKRTALFLSIGMKQQNAVDVLKNEALTKALVDVIHEAGADNGCDPAFGTLLYTVANKLTAPSKNRSLVVQYVKDKKLKTVDQLTAAFKYLSSIGEQEVDKSKFESETGVGVEVTPALIHEAVAKLVAEKKAELLEKRYRFPVGQLIQSLKQSAVLKWADGKAVKDEVDKQVEALLGPRQDSDNQKAAKPEKVEKKAEAKPKEVVHLEKPTDAYAVIKLRALSSDLVGKKVEVNGWVHHLRVQKQAIFIELRDGTGFAQCVISGPAAKLDFVENLCRETSVQLLARVERPPEGKFAKWSGLELHVDWWKVWGPSDPSIEELVNQDSQPDQLFDQRHIVLRGERPATYLRLRSIILTKMRAHFEDRGYVEITPPTICQTPCEGGSELFHVDYFGQDATMTQSSQLYLESVIPVVGDCFCIAPSYRAEKSRTRRHLAEYTHLEAERPFVTFDQLLNSIEDLVVDSMERLWATHKDLILSVNPKFTIPKRPFRRLRYGDAITFLKEHNIYKDEEKKIFYEFGEDIPEAPERKMIEMIGEPVFLTNFPVAIKAFYMPKDKDDPRLTESADLLVPGVGEIVGGSMRIWNYEELMAAYAREKIDPSPFYWFTDQRKFGSVPHGGYGLGVERFLVWVFGDDHIRNVCLYPRWVDRCKP